MKDKKGFKVCTLNDWNKSKATLAPKTGLWTYKKLLNTGVVLSCEAVEGATIDDYGMLKKFKIYIIRNR